jgi:serine/threonine protein kinase
MVEVSKINKPLGELLSSSKAKQDDRSSVNQLKDLLEKALDLDPTKRITPKEAYSHPFFGEPKSPAPTSRHL